MTARARTRTVLLCALMLIPFLIGITHATASTASHAAAAPPIAPPLVKPAVPTTGAYFGAFPLPGGQQRSTAVSHESAIQTFDNQIKGPLAFVNQYFAFTSLTMTAEDLDDAEQGSIPFLSWQCDLAGDGQIIHGNANNYIDQAANSIKAYGHPVFLRWFWEMNLPDPITQQCLGGLGATGYIAAWQYIWNRFQHDGATNAAFVWVPSEQAPDGNAVQFYPGDHYVDWIGADGYDRLHGDQISYFSDVFGDWYHEWAGHKPLFVAEVGSPPPIEGQPEPPYYSQQDWLKNMFTVLPKQFPDIKAVDYFDSFGHAGSVSGKFTLTAGSMAVIKSALLPVAGVPSYFTPPMATLAPTIRVIKNVTYALSQQDESLSPGLKSSPPTVNDVVVTAFGFPQPVLSLCTTLDPTATPPINCSAHLPDGFGLEDSLTLDTRADNGIASSLPVEHGTYFYGTVVGSPTFPDISRSMIYALSTPNYVSQGTLQESGSVALPFEVTGAVPLHSSGNLVATAGMEMQATLLTDSSPYPTLSLGSPVARPKGYFHFADNGNGTATLTVLPDANAGGSYPLTLSAKLPNAMPTSIHINLVVTQSPSVISADAIAAYSGQPFKYTMSAIGYGEAHRSPLLEFSPTATISNLLSVGQRPSWLQISQGITDVQGAANPQTQTNIVLSGTPPQPGVFTAQFEATTLTPAELAVDEAAHDSTTIEENSVLYNVLITVH